MEADALPQTTAEDSPPRFMRLGDRVLDLERNCVLREGEVAKVEPKVMRVIAYLAERPGRVVGRAELVEQVWGGVHVVDEAVLRAVSLARAALGDDARNPSLIETVAARGYRLKVPAGGLAQAAPAAPPGLAGVTGWGLFAALIAAGLIGAMAALGLEAILDKPQTPAAYAPEAPPPPTGTPSAEPALAPRAPSP
jgi:DNA-binding winged helix-turn-helix (wHTH) protein